MKNLKLLNKKTFTSKRVSLWVSIMFIALMLIVTYLPIMYIAIFSFTSSETIGVWTGFSFDLYAEMFTDPTIMTALGNSLLVGVVSGLFATILGTLAAVGIFYMRKIPKIAANGVTQITMVNADIVTGVAFMLFFIAIEIIPGGYATLILAHTIICVPYVIMSVAPRLSQLNRHVYEAGLDLGANHMQTLLKVVMPQLIGGMVAGFMLAFTISFDDFTISKWTWVKGDVLTVPIYLYNSLKRKLPAVVRALSALMLVTVMAILVAINIIQAKRAKKLK